MMNREELKQILEAHRLWVETNGEQGERANLSGPDLCWAHFISNFCKDDLTWRDDLTWVESMWVRELERRNTVRDEE
jgi:hypothetical protein